MWTTHSSLLLAEQSLVEHFGVPLGDPVPVAPILKFSTRICKVSVRFAYQFTSALVGIAIAGETGDSNGRHASLEIHAHVCEFLSALALLNLPSAVSR